MKVKVKLTGEQMTYDSEDLSLYCYRAYTENPDFEEFLLEGQIYTGKEAAIQTLEPLAASLKVHDPNFLFECRLHSPDCEVIGEEFFIE